MDLFNPLRKGQIRDKRESLQREAVKDVSYGAKTAFNKVTESIDLVNKIYIPTRIRKGFFITVCVIAGLLLTMYIPAWILGEANETYYALAYDKSAKNYVKQLYVKDYKNDDFDNDGLTNGEEKDEETNIFLPDTDFDGLSDSAEANELNTNPLKSNNDLISLTKKQDKEAGTSLSEPISDEGVVLWPDSYKDKAYGVVIKDFNGYMLKNFHGWAQFPESRNRYVYVIDDNKAKKPKYRETENAYYIDGDSYVVVLKNKISYEYEISFCGHSKTFKNKVLGNVLSFILPSKGRAYLRCTKSPYFKKITSNTATLIKTCEYTNDYVSRLAQYTNQLEDLTKVWNTIYNHKCVYVSFYTEEKGESIGIVYGYTPDGDLLIADPETEQYAGKLTVEFNAENLYNDGKISKITWFDFKGLGFDSSKGDRLNFFGTENNDKFISYQ